MATCSLSGLWIGFVCEGPVRYVAAECRHGHATTGELCAKHIRFHESGSMGCGECAEGTRDLPPHRNCPVTIIYNRNLLR